MKKILQIIFLFGLAAVISGNVKTVCAAAVYSSEAEFVAALDGYYLEDFDDLEDMYDDGPLSLGKGPVNGFSYAIATIGTNLYYMDGFISTNGPAAPLQFEFTGNNVTAFGGFLWPTDINGFDGVAGIDIEVVLNNGATETYAIENAAFNTFTGFISTEAFTTITFSANNQPIWTYGEGEGLYMSADHIYAGTSVVPVPGAVWLLGSGLLGMVGLRRKAHK